MIWNRNSRRVGIAGGDPSTDKTFYKMKLSIFRSISKLQSKQDKAER
jgi:hypothetical protein